MGRIPWGIAVLGALLGAASSAHAATRVVEGEKLRGGKVVHDARASRGRVLALAPGAAARISVRTAPLGAVIVRARHERCARPATLLVQVDAGTAMPAPLAARFRETTLRLYVPAGGHLVRVSFASGRGKRCRGRIDRLRFRTTRRRPPTAAPDSPVPGTAAPRRTVPLGSSIVLEHVRKDAAYEAALLREFTQLTPENELKMNRVQPAPGEFHFADPDALVDYAAAHGRTLRGHTLIFGRETPPWVGRLLFAEEAEAALRDHIRTVMTRYKGRIREWDVVNEALDENGNYKKNAWTERLGERYVEMAFEEARATDPGARLFYNEFNAETNNRKRAGVLNLARKLKAKGLIDGVGMQLHTGITGYPKREELEDTMRLLADIGLEVQITEMDVIAKGDNASSSLAARLQTQADVFRGAADACVAVPACARFNVWGVTDRYSWMGVEEIPLLLDAGYAAKPALGAVRAALGT